MILRNRGKMMNDDEDEDKLPVPQQSRTYMASSSTSASPPYTGPWKHEVFLCFRGDDVRNNLTSHLEGAMKSRNIDYFIDTKLGPTQDIGELLEILKGTAVSVVIFSGKFADSPWCLDEVSTIAESIEKYGHRALPVFYNVDWNTVVGDYHWFDDWKKAFLSCFLPQPTPYAKTIAGLEATQERKKKWMDSLNVVASKTGRTSESIPREAELIQKVVVDVCTTIKSMSPSFEFKNLVGMDTRVSQVEKLLAMEDDAASLIVGLWGQGGFGKSTLARACYEKLRKHNEKEMKFHFVEKINETCNKSNPVARFVHELYSTLLNEEPLIKSGVDIRMDRLLRLKVFVVLDDVQSILQLEELLLGKALTELFAAGSRIIITTRDRGVLNYATAEMYRVDHLSDDESLELFKLRAFKDPGDVQVVEQVNLSREVVKYCQGNPLALNVLGATLRNNDKAYWISFLGKLGKNQDKELHSVLRRSYDELGNDEKRLFLDISCFFYGTVRSLLVKYMDSSYTSSYHTVEDLIRKSLLMTTDDKIQGEKVTVHSLLREMAWNIVDEEEIIGKRSRLKNHDDIRILLSQEGKRETQGICLDLSKADVMLLKSDAFEGMDSLRWLDFGWPNSVGYANRKIQLSGGDLNFLPNELRGLNWDHFPCHSLPSGFSPRKLIYLVIRHSPIHACWQRDQPKLEYLMLLCLSNCENLATVPNLSSCSYLEHLLLRGCTTLVELPESIQFLENLVTLDARDCQKLARVPSKLNSKFLKQLLLSNCPNLTRCPKVNSPELQDLDLDGTPIKSLPTSIYKVKQDGVVSLYGPNIAHFPQIHTRLSLLLLRGTTIKEIKFKLQQQLKFDRLHLIQNTQLATLPTEIWDMVSKELIVEDCPMIECLPVLSEPHSSSLTMLHIVGCKKITEFPACICKLNCLEVLVFVGTDVKSLPTCIGELKQLSYLDLSYSTKLESLPGTIIELGKLSELVLIGCGSNLSLTELLPPKLNVVKEKKHHRTSTLQALLGNQNLNDLMLDFSSQLIGSLIVIPYRNMSEAGVQSFSRSMKEWAAKRKQRQSRTKESTGGPMRRKRKKRRDQTRDQNQDENRDRIFNDPTQQLNAYYSPLPDHRHQARARISTRPTEQLDAYDSVVGDQPVASVNPALNAEILLEALTRTLESHKLASVVKKNAAGEKVQPATTADLSLVASTSGGKAIAHTKNFL